MWTLADNPYTFKRLGKDQTHCSGEQFVGILTTQQDVTSRRNLRLHGIAQRQSGQIATFQRREINIKLGLKRLFSIGSLKHFDRFDRIHAITRNPRVFTGAFWSIIISPSPVSNQPLLMEGYLAVINSAKSWLIPLLPFLIWYRFSLRFRPICSAKALIDNPVHLITCSRRCHFSVLGILFDMLVEFVCYVVSNRTVRELGSEILPVKKLEIGGENLY